MEEIKKATRQSYGEALVELGKENLDIVVLDADLSTATKTELFAKKYPERFFDMGISEGNMFGVASGLASSGKIPYASTFAVFAAGRSYDQIRCSIAYPKLNVKICASHCRNNSRRRWCNTSNVRRHIINENNAKYDSNFSL